jgi:hypothetical protein
MNVVSERLAASERPYNECMLEKMATEDWLMAAKFSSQSLDYALEQSVRY